ncbi:MAG: DUF839 domain-containing protein, partial [Sporichthyaceae bacterium]|nr:DUF839 domain-containing protein [Sporichthyaceae bacterium]
MVDIDRRSVLRTTAIVAGGAAMAAGGALVGGPFAGLLNRAAHAGGGNAPFRELGPVADLRDGAVRLWLPEGFQYRSFHDTEYATVLDDGTNLPGRHDGMAAFAGPGGNVLLVRNHEVNGPGVGPDFAGAPNVALTQRHGFIFEVPAGGQSNRQPITQAGRFAHEACAFDPHDGILYLTEDNFGFPSGFYRYLPAHHPMHTGQLDNGGRLQMLAVRGQPNAD